MASSGIAVDDSVGEMFERLKIKKEFKYLVLKIDESGKSVVVDTAEKRTECDKDDDWFLDCCLKDHCDPNKPRWFVADCRFCNKEGQQREKVALFSWIPDCCPIKERMKYASTQNVLKSKLSAAKMISLKDDSDKCKENIISQIE